MLSEGMANYNSIGYDKKTYLNYTAKKIKI